MLLARDATGYRSLCRLVSRANLAGTKGVPRFSQALLAAHTEGLVALSGCRDGEIARRLRVGDRDGARAVAEGYAGLFATRGQGSARGGSRGSIEPGRAGPRRPTRRPAGVVAAGFVLELQHHLLPDDDWLVAETARLAEEVGLPVVVTNDVHYALPEDRELQDVLTAIRHGRTVETLADLRRPDGESYLKSADELLALPPGDGGRATTGGRRAPGPRGSPTPASWPPPARSTSASRRTASPASRCRGARRRSATSPSSATPAPGGATTR